LLDQRPAWTQPLMVFSVPRNKKDQAPQETPRETWLRIMGLGAGLVLAAFLLWSSLGTEDGVTEVLAHRGEVLAGRFIEVPCSEDYDGHRRFEGMVSPAQRQQCPWSGGSSGACGEVTDMARWGRES
uniref:Uncharacterized protein n=1 Tax=Spermophilus dauricus TaxID=99837 RepID=A0A8C9Q555_SPEDA